MTSSILTYSGKLFDVLNPDPELIDLIDIAAALSKLCRFGGHCRHFYSVAEHSVLASDLIQKTYPGNQMLARWALLHDASEAYMVDIPRPVKRQLHQYVRLEDAIQETIAKRFNLPWPMPQEVHDADGEMLLLELHAYMPNNPNHQIQSIANKVSDPRLPEIPDTPAIAEAAFMDRARQLGVL